MRYASFFLPSFQFPQLGALGHKRYAFSLLCKTCTSGVLSGVMLLCLAEACFPFKLVDLAPCLFLGCCALSLLVLKCDLLLVSF